jgi:capsule polysaccharide export protein KpsE/RkpR
VGLQNTSPRGERLIQEKIEQLQQQLSQHVKALMSQDPATQHLMGQIKAYQEMENETGPDESGLSVVQGGADGSEDSQADTEGGG